MAEKSEFTLRQIGVVHTSSGQEEVKGSRGGGDADIEIFPEFSDGLEGIDGFSHLFVVGFFDRLREDQKGVLQVRPRRLLRFGLKPEELPLVGVFSLDSPSRPNPIGLSLVRLLGRDGRVLHVTGLDYFDGTPVVDLKAYQPSYHAAEYLVPEWHSRLHERAEKER